MSDMVHLLKGHHMKKMFWVAGVLLMLFACSGQKSVTFFSGNLAEALTDAEQQDKLVMLDFYSPT